MSLKGKNTVVIEKKIDLFRSWSNQIFEGHIEAIFFFTLLQNCLKKKHTKYWNNLITYYGFKRTKNSWLFTLNIPCI